MLPRLFSVDWASYVLHLNGYGFSIFCGALAALLILLRRAGDAGIPERPLLWIVLLSIAGGFAAGRVAFAIQYGRSPFTGGLVLYGGLIGGVATAVGMSRRFGLPPLAVADLATPCLLLAASFGRIGCFLAGCCHGAVWDGGLTYPALSHAWHSHRAAGLIAADAPRSLPTVPAPLLEAAALLLCFVAASRVWTRRPKPGTTLALCGLLYSSWRFLAEFWRGDHGPFWGSTLTFSQGISAAVFAGSLLLLVRRPALQSHPPFRAARVPAIQVSAILIAAASLGGSVGCSAKDRYDAAGEVVEGCMEACIEACTESCQESCNQCCEDAISKAGQERSRIDPESRQFAPIFRWPRLEPGSSHSGKITLRGEVNERLGLSLDLSAEVQALSKDEAGTLYLRVQVRELILSLGDLSLPDGAGTLELSLDRRGHVLLRTSTLPNEALSILKAVEPLTKGLLQLEIPATPSEAWSRRINGELNTPDPRARIQGDVEADGRRRDFHATALVTLTAEGERRLQWIPIR